MKKESPIDLVNHAVLKRLNPTHVIVIIQMVEEDGIDEMWSFVGSEKQQRWLWHGIDHTTRKILAYVLEDWKDAVFLKLKALLKTFGMTRFYTGHWGAYERHLPVCWHTVGKQKIQHIERKHLTLRTRIKRLARKTICFSKRARMHDIVIGLFINRYEFGTLV